MEAIKIKDVPVPLTAISTGFNISYGFCEWTEHFDGRISQFRRGSEQIGCFNDLTTVANMTVALHVRLSGFIVESRHTEISYQLSGLVRLGSQQAALNIVTELMFQ